MSISELFAPQKSYTDLAVHSVLSPTIVAGRSYTVQPISIGSINFSTSATETLSVDDIVGGIYLKATNGAATVSLPTSTSLDLSFPDPLYPFISFTFIAQSGGDGTVTFNLGAGTAIQPPGGGSSFQIIGGEKKYITYCRTLSGWKVLVGTN